MLVSKTLKKRPRIRNKAIYYPVYNTSKVTTSYELPEIARVKYVLLKNINRTGKRYVVISKTARIHFSLEKLS